MPVYQEQKLLSNPVNHTDIQVIGTSLLKVVKLQLSRFIAQLDSLDYVTFHYI